jgi:sporulation protein YlmC with PRC-barrel domain
MKAIQRTILISLVPLLTTVTAFAEAGKQAAPGGTLGVAPNPETKAGARASQLIGLNVKNATEQTIGEVKDLVLDMKSGEVLAVIISSGGFLGMADTLSAVPLTSLRYDGAAKRITTSLTKEQLGKAPQFKGDAWPDYSQPAPNEALRSFRDSIGGGVTDRQPSAPDDTARDTATDTTAPDNSARNKNEISKGEVNPIDQGNSSEDVRITKDIRSALMDADLSFNAKNIKIITRNEHVTLKGVVESDAEHQAILKIARNHANTANITDNLKVKSK